MANRITRHLMIIGLTALLPACASTGVATAPDDTASVYDDKINAALSRAAGEANRQGATGGSLILLERVYKRNPESDEAATEFARGLRNAGELQKAQLVLEPFASKPDAKAPTLTEFASLRLNQTQYAAAEALARKAVAKDKNAYQAYQVLGIALDAQERYEDAEAAFRQALDLWQGDPIPVMNNLALNLTNQERLAEALEIMEKAKEAAPNRPEVERNLRIIRTLNESATGRPAPKPAEKPKAKPIAEVAPTTPKAEQPVKAATAVPAPSTVSGSAPAPAKGMQPIMDGPSAAKSTAPATSTKAVADKPDTTTKAAATPEKLPDVAPAAGANTKSQQ